MPHRHQEFRDLCIECDALSTGACRRCDVPLCAAHLPGRGQRCGGCERDFELAIVALDHELNLPVGESRAPRFVYRVLVGVAVTCALSIGLLILGASLSIDFLMMVAGVTMLVAMVVAFPSAALAMPIVSAAQGLWRARSFRKLHHRRARRRFLRERCPRALPPPSTST